jgi:hypothetical protein
VKALHPISKACLRIHVYNSSPDDGLGWFIDQDPVRRRTCIATAVIWCDRVRQAPSVFKRSTLGSGADASPADGKVFAVAAENTDEIGFEPT